MPEPDTQADFDKTKAIVLHIVGLLGALVLLAMKFLTPVIGECVMTGTVVLIIARAMGVPPSNPFVAIFAGIPLVYAFFCSPGLALLGIMAMAAVFIGCLALFTDQLGD